MFPHSQSEARSFEGYPFSSSSRYIHCWATGHFFCFSLIYSILIPFYFLSLTTMTEYDYSEEAYQKYLESQARIARWVDNTQNSRLVPPDVPPTPLGDETNIPLKPGEEFGFRRREPFKPSKYLPEPGCPVYYPPPTPPPEPTKRRHKKRSGSTSAPATRPPTPYRSSKELPEPGRSDYNMSDSPPSRSVRQAAARKRSMSFSVPATRPSPPPATSTPQHYRGTYPEHGGCYFDQSPQNLSPSYSHPSSMTFPPQPTAHPQSTAQLPTPPHIVHSLSYPLPYQQYPNYDAVRRAEPVRSSTAPAHASHYSMDNKTYSYPVQGYSHHPEQPYAYAHQSYLHQTPPSHHPLAQVPISFPSGKTILMTPSKSNQIDYSRVRI